MLITFIPGIPRPQGSKNAYKRGTAVVMVESNKRLPEWRKRLVQALQAQLGNEPQFATAVTVEATFYLKRAKSNRKTAVTQKPDLDKLARALGDALTISGVLKDDSYIVEWRLMKLYAEFEQPGVEIEIKPFNANTPR